MGDDRSPRETRSATSAGEPSSSESFRPLEAPAVSLPKGGGALRGIGEKFGANPVTGTGSWSIAVPASPGRGGFDPHLALAYDSGAGNGSFGFGWRLELSAITRKTEKGLPEYRDAEESDVFVLSGTEDLVPVSGANDIRFEDDTTEPDYVIHRYRPRVESLYARIERWTRKDDGDVHWRSLSRDNVLTLYGADASSRIADPTDPARVFKWLVCETRDDKGNGSLYEYVGEDAAGVDLTQANERNRGDADDPRRTANRYLKRVLYGNRTPLLDNSGRRPAFLSAPQRTGAGWMFELVLDYGEGHFERLPPAGGTPEAAQHRLAEATPAATRPWSVRPDPFSTYTAGFEIRTYRRCERILMFHHVPDTPGGSPGYDGLVRVTELDYDDLDYSQPVAIEDELAHEGSTRFASFVRAATLSGFSPTAAAGTYVERSLPAVEFRYSQPAIQDDVRELDRDSLENLPTGLGAANQWVDLDGEGIAGILTEQDGAWFYKPNLGDGSFGALETVPARPSLADLTGGRQQLLDLAGDGRLALVSLEGSTPGFHQRTADAGWDEFRPFDSLPSALVGDPNLRFVDLNGDGHADAVVTEGDVISWQPSLDVEGFGALRTVRAPIDEERGPRLVFADGTQSIYVADMSGDGLADLVRIRNAEVCYWPSLGYGRFGAKVTMDGAPLIDAPEAFDQRRVRLADIDGSGTSDVLYLAPDGVRLYFNQSGNRLSEARTLPPLPHVDDVTSVTTADLLGNGTACLVWSSPLPADAGRPLRYIDLMGGTKPHLLVGAANGLGTETAVRYAPSTRFYLDDKRAGRPWITRLPFPVHVVERVDTIDRISGNRFVSRYAYHHGSFDGAEREFRGFGMVEQWDTEEFAVLGEGGPPAEATNLDAASDVPPAYTKTWFHTGTYLGREHVADFYAGLLDAGDAGEYYREPGLTDAQARALLLDDTVLPSGLTVDEEREACRALKGSMLRQEAYALDGSDREDHPYTVTEQNYSVRLLQSRGHNRHAVFATESRESLSYHYERDPSDPRVGHALTLEVDSFGNVLRSAAIGYGRRAPDPSLDTGDQAKQAQVLVTYTENALTGPIDDQFAYRTPVAAESRTYELTGLDPPPAMGRFGLDTVRQATSDADVLAFEDTPSPGTLEKRLIDAVRTYFRRDDLTGVEPLGTTGALAIPHQRYKLVLTPGLRTQVYGGRVSDAMFAEGGYVQVGGDPGWWLPTGQSFLSPGANDTPAQELANARAHFFLPRRYRDPFHTNAVSTETVVDYDEHDVAVRRTRDPLGNTQTILRHDYRVLQPALVEDANGNRSEVVFDALGQVAANAIMGKPAPAPAEGDALAGVAADLTRAQIEAFFADPLGPMAANLLGGATTRTLYDETVYARDPTAAKPTVGATIRREVHLSDLDGGDASRLHVSLSYSDGFGRQIQAKGHVRAGPVPRRDAGGEVMLGADGQPLMTAADVDPRWVTTGWTVYDNKGKPVRQYEPFFSDTHEFEFDVRVGVSPVLFYDSAGRNIATLYPDHTWEKVAYDPWKQETWDTTDTIALDPLADPDLGGFFARLAPSDYLPTWAALRTDPAHAGEAALRWPDADDRAAQKDAGEKAAICAATPTVAHADSLGRPVLTVVHNRFKYSDTPPADAPVEETYASRSIRDIRGNVRESVDALGRILGRYDYDMAGRRLHQTNIDAGPRWSLPDVVNKPLYDWNARGHVSRTTYDALRRALDTTVREGAGPELVVSRTTYGESRPNPEASNLRGQVVEGRDQAGLVTTPGYDFKGSPTRTVRQLAETYSATIDWSQPVTLHAESFASFTRHDALGRPIQMVAPHSDEPGTEFNVIQPEYDDGGLLRRLRVWMGEATEPAALLDPATASMQAVTDVAYDAKGRRVRVDNGNGSSTRYDYDRHDQRLISAITTRGADDLQSLHYAYDPAGNVTGMRDAAQQTIFFRNKRVTPDAGYTYDAISRLIEATGREHVGQAGGSPVPSAYDDAPRIGIPHPGDGDAMARYIERYSYDGVGNIVSMRHRGTDPVAAGWSRDYTYEEPSQIEPGRHANRLTSTSVGAATDVYSAAGDGYDAHGNMLRMPQLQSMAWDFRDQLQMTRRQAVNPADASGTAHAGERTFYVYSAAGDRVRKVTETPAGAIKDERVYFGGFEVYRRPGADTLVRETLHLVDGSQRVALVETRTHGTEPGVPAQLVRYQHGSLLGSVALELDAAAQIISYEEYTPYGSTTYQGVRSQTETPKRYRYSGTERDDASGLNHNGARYYATWLGRWTSCDPMGVQGGASLYAYCRGNPVSRADPGGMSDGESSAVGVSIDSRGITLGTFVVAPDPNRANYVVGFGRWETGYMRTAETNTGLRAINIQDSINILQGRGLHFPSSWQAEEQWQTPEGDPRTLYPMFSGVMAQEALEGNAAATVHYDMRNVTLTPPLRSGQPGISADDFHSSSEARQGIAHLASTAPGERKVTIVIQHEDGISTIRPGSNVVEGDPLPQRLADRVPNLNNTGTTTPGTNGVNGGTSNTGTGATGGNSGGTGTGSNGGGTGSNAGSRTGGNGSGSGSGGGGSRSGGGSRPVTAPSAVSGMLGGVGRMVPGVVEGEAVLFSAAAAAAGHASTVGLVAPLMTAAEALPVAAGAGIVGAGVGLATRAAASELGADQATANTIGFGTAVLAGAAMGSFIPGVGTAVGAGIGAAIAGGLYLYSIW